MALRNRFDKATLASLAFVISGIIQKIISFIAMPFYTNLLTLEQYGQFSLYTSWYCIFEILATAGLCNGVINNGMVKYKDDQDGFVSSVQSLCSLCIVTCFILTVILWPLICNIIKLPLNIVILIFIQLFFCISFLLYTTKEKYFFRFKTIVAANILIAVLSNLISIVYIISNPANLNNGYMRILVNVFVYAVFGLIFYILNLYKGKKIFNKEYWSYSLKFSIPLVPYLFFAIMLDNIDSIFISNILDNDSLAIYSFNNQLALIPNFINAALYSVLTPMVYRYLNENKTDQLKRAADLSTYFLMFIIVGLMIITPEMIMLLGNDLYINGIKIVAPTAITVLIRFIFGFFIAFEMYSDKTYIPSIITFIALLINLILNYSLIPEYGYIAVGYNKLAVYMIMGILHYMTVRNFAKLLNLKKELRYLYFVLLTAFTLNSFYNDQILRLIIGLIVLVLSGMGIIKKFRSYLKYEKA